jgi:voltage-gated potassium channel
MSRSPESPAYQLFMLALCVLTLADLAAEALFTLDTQSRLVLDYADTALCAIFFGDFLLSLKRAENRWKYFRTWGWLDLVSSIPSIHLARWGRAARIARILRVLRGVRAARILGRLALTRKTESTFLAASLVALLLIVVGSLSVLQFESAEGSNIRTAEDALWWSITTITTVGYGDRFPVTTEGRLVAVLLMCGGVGLFGMFSGFLAAWFVSPSTKREAGEIEALKEEVRQMRLALEALRQ